jgi:hypothetical protein
VPREYLGERALTRTVRAHDGMNFASVYSQIDAAKDFLTFGGRMQILYL